MRFALCLDRRPGQPHRLLILGHRRTGLYLVRGPDGGIRWRCDRPVRWRRWCLDRRLDAEAADEVADALGLDWLDAGSWDRAVTLASERAAA